MEDNDGLQNYYIWDQFQQRVKILDPYEYKGGKTSNVIFEMKTSTFGIVREQVIYADEEQMIFMYGFVNISSQGFNVQTQVKMPFVLNG